jgi:hypothetical protein
MRGDERIQNWIFSYVSFEQRVLQDHPLRLIHKSVNFIPRNAMHEGREDIQ